MTHYRSNRVLAGRIRLNVLDWEGAAPPILFVHGFSNNATSALALGKLLAGRRRLIAPDLRGRGFSDMPFGGYGIAVHVRDLVALMQRLAVPRFVIAGHSLGAAIAIFLAAQYPERVTGLILFDGGAMPSPLAAQMLNAYYDNLTYRYTSMDAYVSRYKGAPAYEPWTDEMDQMVRSNLLQQPDGTYFRRVPRYVIDADRRADNLQTWQQLPKLYHKIECPVLILRAGMGMIGTQDQVLSDETVIYLRTALHSASVVTVEEAGHTSLLTIPSQKRDRAILDFLGLR